MRRAWRERNQDLLRAHKRTVDAAKRKRTGGFLSRAVTGALTGAVSGALIGAASGLATRSKVAARRKKSTLAHLVGKEISLVSNLAVIFSGHA
jgi:uncharacterized membrane protein